MKKILLLIGIFLITGCQVKEENTIQKIDEKAEVAIGDEKRLENDTFERYLKEPENKPKKVLIKVFKELRFLELYGDDQLIAKFKVALGGEPKGNKNREGDRKTPEGKYYICTRNDKSKFTLFLGISYPNIEDANKGLEECRIIKKEFEDIKEANENKTRPNWYTKLGGEVGIHGGGTSTDWTWGCMALSDKDIRILWTYAKLKTPVEIYE